MGHKTLPINCDDWEFEVEGYAMTNSRGTFLNEGLRTLTVSLSADIYEWLKENGNSDPSMTVNAVLRWARENGCPLGAGAQE